MSGREVVLRRKGEEAHSGDDELGGYPVGPPRVKGTPAWVWVLLVFFILSFTIVVAGISYVRVGPDCPTDDGIHVLNLLGIIVVDEDDGVLNLSLQHRGGNLITWGEYRVTVNGIAMSGTPYNGADGMIAPRSYVGETVYWNHHFSDGVFVVGDTCTIKVIKTDTSSIVWEKDLVAESYTG